METLLAVLVLVLTAAITASGQCGPSTLTPRTSTVADARIVFPAGYFAASGSG